MSDSSAPVRTGMSTAMIIAGLFAAMIAIVLAVELGMLADGLAKRAVVATFALMMGVAGNLWPKLVGSLGEYRDQPGRGIGVDLLTGRTFVAGGLVLLVVAVATPVEQLIATAAVVGLLCFGTVAVWALRRSADVGLPALGSPRGALLHIFLGLFGAFGLFLVDVLWGDTAAQWSAVVYIVVAGLVVAGQRSRVPPDPERGHSTSADTASP